jgi:cytochrome c
LPGRHSSPIIAALFASVSTGPVFAQDGGAGETVFNKCKACHQVGEGAKSRTGPILNGVVGATAGARDDFKYSDALIESGLTWDEETLAQYLRKPKDLVPKTKMAFAGLKGDGDIANVIAYLASFDATGARN